VAKGKYQQWLEPDGLLLLAAWARDGLTNEQIAKKCDIAESTLYAWMDTYPEISEALKKGKEITDIEVENALKKRAVGYSYTETMTETGPDGVKVRKTVKQVAPDVTAQIFWLKNRKRDQWRDKQLDDGADADALEKAKEMLGGVPSAF